MIRWKYLLPRITLAVILFTAAKFAVPWLLRVTTIETLRATTGMVANVDHVWLWPLHGKVRVDGVKIARGPSSHKNLFEYQSAIVALDLAALARRRVVVDQVDVRGLRLGTYRASGTRELERAQLVDGQFSRWPGLGSDLSRQWWRALSDGLQSRVEDQFESVRLARNLSARWYHRYNDLASQIAQCEQQARQFHEKLGRVPDMLRNGDSLKTIQETRQEGLALQSQIEQLRQSLRRLPEQMRDDRTSIQSAMDRDRARLRDTMNVVRLDEGRLSTSFFTGEIHNWLDQLQPWLEVARWITADPSARATRQRGVSVLFSRPLDEPGVLIRQASLEGQIDVRGRSLPFVGRADNLTTSLRRPAHLEFEVAGASHATVTVTLDRPHESVRQAIKIDAERVPIPARTWGSTDGFAVAIDPADTDVRFTLINTDDQLEGTLWIAAANIQLLPVVAASAGTDMLQQHLAAALADLDSFEMTARIHGAADDPRFEIESNLGHEMQKRVRTVLQNTLNEHADQLARQAEQIVSQQLAQVRTELSRRQTTLTEQLDLGRKLVTSITKPATASRTQWTRLLSR